jgi:hypothetical protein
MNPQDLKTRVKESFSDVESEELLHEQIKKGIEKHRRNWGEFNGINPYKDFDFWKKKNEEININTNSNEEIMAMGIFLLALDEFEKELKIS